MTNRKRISIIGAGTIGTALGNVLAESGAGNILLHSIEENVVSSVNEKHINSRYFPGVHLHPSLRATSVNGMLEDSDLIFLAIPSVSVVGYLRGLKSFIPPKAILINLAKGFGCRDKTIVECLQEDFINPVFTLKGPSFAKEIINRIPTGFTLGYKGKKLAENMAGVFSNSTIFLDFSEDIRGVEILSILNNIYAIVLGIVDAQFNSPNLRFLILTRAFREMMNVLVYFGGKEDTIYKYCGYGDFTLTALNDLSRNRTLGLLIGKGFFTEHVSHELVLEGKTAATVFYEKISDGADVGKCFPILSELYKVLNGAYDISNFVNTILGQEEP